MVRSINPFMIKVGEMLIEMKMKKMTTVKNIRTYLKEKQLDGLLVTSPHNRRYTTGFTGSSGVVLITEADAVLITDFRYIEQAEREASGFDIIKHDASIVEEVKQQVNRMKVERLAFEAEHMTMAQYSDYSEKISCE